MDTPWIAHARTFLGLREVPGARHNATILGWWQKIFADFRDDETPWCAAFVGGVLEEVGIKSTRSAAARSYLKWGQPLNRPVPGCVVVFWRGSPSGWSGHVGFVVGKDADGNLMVLGGNQGDAVNIKPFGRDRVLGYRWPDDLPLPGGDLPLLRSDGRLSTNEA
ncbi:NlpC/P60 family protein [Xanthobacter flavus]|uniref:NlpC/P60 family protein n=1 Tax=Xanthobacter flavus TaxID=281 RepID=UPI0037279FF6